MAASQEDRKSTSCIKNIFRQLDSQVLGYGGGQTLREVALVLDIIQLIRGHLQSITYVSRATMIYKDTLSAVMKLIRQRFQKSESRFKKCTVCYRYSIRIQSGHVAAVTEARYPCVEASNTDDVLRRSISILPA